jgi:hypothetical protein
MRVFVSSTFEDLREYRAAAIRSLRQLGHEVVAMEEFTAASAPPVQVVLEKVEQADAYLGLFAWRYGYVPRDDAAFPEGTQLPDGAVPKKTSITHLEYLRARELDLPILAFLLEEAAPWPPDKVDAFKGETSGRPKLTGTSIRELRKQLQSERVVAFFSSPAEVEARVATAVTNLGMSRGMWRNLVHLTNPLSQGSPVPDSDVFFAIRNEIATASETGRRMSTIDIATPWWSTRLYYLGVLAREFTNIERIVVVKGDSFVGVLSVATAIDRMEAANPKLSRFARTLRGARRKYSDQAVALDAAQAAFEKLLPNEIEMREKAMVTAPNLATWFGDAMLKTAIEVEALEAATLLDLVRIQAYPNEFVPVHARRPTANGSVGKRPPSEEWEAAPIALVDKTALNEQLSRQYLGELMDKAGLG